VQRRDLRDDRLQPRDRHVGPAQVGVAELDDADGRLARGPAGDGDAVADDDGARGGVTITERGENGGGERCDQEEERELFEEA